jgi:peptidyl-prolyl cis-trans isomerase D
VAKSLSDIAAQEREVQELLPVADFVPVKVTDDMVKAFYDKNAKVRSAGTGQDRIRGVQQRRREPGQRERHRSVGLLRQEHRAIHHAGNPPRQPHPGRREGRQRRRHRAAKAKAEAILAEVRKAPADFAKIAKAKSEDPGSAEQGGDLGVIEKGLLVPPVEAPSTSSSRARSAIRAVGIGFHIVTVTELKPAVAKPLDAVKATWPTC